MIIIQTSANDASTQSVIQWLSFFGEDFLRLDDNTFVEIKRLDRNHVILLLNGEEVDFNKIKSFWYRRGHFFLRKENEKNSLNIFLKKENEEAFELLQLKLLDKKHIGNYKYDNVNKLIVSELAEKCGLDVPDYMITNNKSDLLEFRGKYQKIITKHIQGLPFFKIENYMMGALTKIVETEDIINFEENFSHSLFQEYIDKEIEIRSFFINDNFYSSAIFSQNDGQTTVDFRDYNRTKPNRVTPFKLPKEIEEKLKSLNKKLNINSGSYDLILSKDSKYYFLEVNPIGQFAQVSGPCNYYLERKIAEELL